MVSLAFLVCFHHLVPHLMCPRVHVREFLEYYLLSPGKLRAFSKRHLEAYFKAYLEARSSGLTKCVMFVST